VKVSLFTLIFSLMKSFTFERFFFNIYFFLERTNYIIKLFI